MERNKKGKTNKRMMERKRGIKHMCNVKAHPHVNVSTDAHAHGGGLLPVWAGVFPQRSVHMLPARDSLPL